MSDKPTGGRIEQLTDRRNYVELLPKGTHSTMTQRIAELEQQVAALQEDVAILKALNQTMADSRAVLWEIVAPGYEGEMNIHEYCRSLVKQLQDALKDEVAAETELDKYKALADRLAEALLCIPTDLILAIDAGSVAEKVSVSLSISAVRQIERAIVAYEESKNA